MKADHDANFIFKSGGGFGTNISHIRPKGSPVGNTYNAATGPIDLVLEKIDNSTNLVKAGGKRRGANMGIMEYWHPQILEFIDYKLQTIPPNIQEVIDLIKTMKHPREQEMIRSIIPPGRLLNFNISVMFDDIFWSNYNNDDSIPLTFGNIIYAYINARELMKKIADNAWKSAEPGVLFSDNANKKNPLRELWGDIKITNPCVSAGTRLHTSRGMKTVGELYESNESVDVAVDTVLHKSFKRYSRQNETLMMQMKASKVFMTSESEEAVQDAY